MSMLSVFYCVALAGLALSSLTRHRIFIMCGFYAFYALLTIMDEGNVPHVGPITVYRALYLIISISIVARFIQDRGFLAHIRRWPLLPYLALIIVLLTSSLYSVTHQALDLDQSGGLWSRMVVLLLFFVGGCHIHRELDLQLFGITTVGVSLALSLFVIWNAAQLNFEAYRGGIKTDMNYVSTFIFLGTLALINVIFVSKTRLSTFLWLPLLLCQLFAALILASRGGFAAFVVACILMAAGSFRSLGPRRLWGAVATLVLVIGIALLLPGSENLVGRFGEGDIGTLNERALVWSESWKYFGDSSLVRMMFGQGLLSAPTIVGPVVPDLANYHNEYLRWLMDAGILGLAAFFVFLYGVGRKVVENSHPLKHLMKGWFVYLLVDGFTYANSDSHLFWILLGLMVADACLENETGSLPRPIPGRPPQTSSSLAPVPRALEGN
jgi:O-antigen ligase/polysaccharide polymerase Wzy-like membrane protein